MNEAKSCMNALADQTEKIPFFLFVGDSRIQQMRDGLIFALTGQDYDVYANRQPVLNSTTYSNFGADENIYKATGAQIKFEWQPHLDSGLGPMSTLLKNISKLQYKPDLLVIGAGVWSIKECELAKNIQETCAAIYREQFRSMLPRLEELATTTDIVWAPQNAIRENLMTTRNIDRGFTNKNMQLYNDMVRQVLISMYGKLQGSPVIFWESAWEVSVRLGDGIDGVHLGHDTKLHLAQMILDWICRPVSLESEFAISESLNTPGYCCL
ncbi:hypothetical protein BV898_14887 [Hypsibius exemplaris]|uniref:CAS1 domain-containing protein 1 n=1 Tax=Hypsibius exemplaris TaxID=2072580 RepID=A0A9X6NBU7_HYPEX|nr:hypothetical protein BV898_14887 [Hypsibius exemplaris]